jgi:ABC-type lipoprotein release transport system permease subunit
MRLGRLLARELTYRKLNLALAVTSVALGVAGVVGSVLTLRLYDLETRQTLAEMAGRSRRAWDRFQDEMRKDMLDMGFNLMIVHKDHNLSGPPEQAAYLPESYTKKLADSRLALINHVLPFLEQKVWWAERKRWITLRGTTGEVYVQDPKRQVPMQARVQKGMAILGYAIHQSLDLKTGDAIVLSGRSFTIQECQPAKGFEEDEQVWISLDEAQEMLDKKGLITGLLAVNCQCEPKDMIKIHRAVAAILPDTQVVEYRSRLLARANVRSKAAREADEALKRETLTRAELREKRMALAAVLVPLVVAISVAWLGFLMWSNVQHRRVEIGILSAMGLSSLRILILFIGKALVVGLVGSLLGFGAGVTFVAVRAGGLAAIVGRADVPAAAGYLAAAVLMSVVASWVPALVASRIDPAVTLRDA